MKNVIKKVFGAAAILSICFAVMSLTASTEEGGRIKVYLQNKCSSDVKIKVVSPGSSTHYTVDDGTKKPMSFMEGTKIYDSDGNLAHEVTSRSEGTVVVVCD